MRPALLAAALCACAPPPEPGDEPTDTPAALAPITPTVTWERTPIAGVPATWWLPSDARAVVWLFHGTGGDALFPDNLECTSLLNTFVDAGYGFVAVESTDRGARTWDVNHHDLSENADLRRIADVHDTLAARGDLDDQTPTFGLGFSNGAAFLGPFSTLARESRWPLMGLAAHNGVPTGARGGALPHPIFFVTADNDQTVLPRWVEDRHAAQIDAGQPAQLARSPEGALTRDWFIRVPNIDADESARAFDAYVALGIIDTEGRRLPAPQDLEGALDGARDHLGVDRAPQITTAARVRFALHAFDGRFAQAELDFLDALR
jgi:predicted esterase